MNSIVRVTGVVAKTHCANPADCVEEIISLLESDPLDESDIIVLPRLALCSPSCGNLLHNGALLEQCEQALTRLQQATEHLDGYVVAGLAVDGGGKALPLTAVLRRGELLGLLPDEADFVPSNNLPGPLLPADTVFQSGSLRFGVRSCALPGLTLQAGAFAESGCDLVVVPAYSPIRAGSINEACQSARAVSKAAGCAVAIVNGGVGDTSSPYVYNGFVAIYECGERLAFRSAGYAGITCTADVDADVVQASRVYKSTPQPLHAAPAASKHQGGLLRPVPRCPWLPAGHQERYLAELFDLQVRSLAVRMENIGITKLVLGVSGGLDSTASLLVSAAAVDTLGLPRENIIGITMPGFGTSDRTYYNALSLLEALGVTRRDISIRQAVQVHLEDIGHTGIADTVYENAQARERAQILLDVANAVSGLVVGTGDLSEEALGFCTFAGDHIANYNVNVCIPKSVLRLLVRQVAQSDRIDSDITELIGEILDTPVSPELLPPEDSGEIKQKTEEILGPYELHDFFLYYFVRYNMRPSKIFFYACIAFSGEMGPDFIRDKLQLFFRKFCAGQFKRACAPDAASITEVNLCGINYYIPSDLDPSSLLRELEENT